MHTGAGGRAEPSEMSRPSYSRQQLATVRQMLAKGAAITAVAQATGLGRQAVYRIKADPVAAEASLTAWEQRPLVVALGRYRSKALKKSISSERPIESASVSPEETRSG